MKVLVRFLGIIFFSLAVLLGLTMAAIMPVGGWEKLLLCLAVGLSAELTARQMRRYREDDDDRGGPPNGGEPAKEGA